MESENKAKTRPAGENSKICNFCGRVFSGDFCPDFGCPGPAVSPPAPGPGPVDSGIPLPAGAGEKIDSAALAAAGVCFCADGGPAGREICPAGFCPRPQIPCGRCDSPADWVLRQIQDLDRVFGFCVDCLMREMGA